MLLLLHVLYVVHVRQRLITVQIGFLPVRTRHLPAPEGSAIFVMSYEKENFHHTHTMKDWRNSCQTDTEKLLFQLLILQ